MSTPNDVKKERELRHASIDILVEELRIGDQIGTVFREDKETGERLIIKSKPVKEIEECPGQWRTHIHVNRQDCYDLRQYVSIKA